MHELAAVDANVALNHTQVLRKSVAPRLSEYCSVKARCVPAGSDAPFGATESAVTTGFTTVTVYLPRCAQPLLCPDPFAAYMKMLLVPANEERNRNVRV